MKFSNIFCSVLLKLLRNNKKRNITYLIKLKQTKSPTRVFLKPGFSLCISWWRTISVILLIEPAVSSSTQIGHVVRFVFPMHKNMSCTVLEDLKWKKNQTKSQITKHKSMMGIKMVDRNYDLSKNTLLFYVESTFSASHNIVAFQSMRLQIFW